MCGLLLNNTFNMYSFVNRHLIHFVQLLLHLFLPQNCSRGQTLGGCWIFKVGLFNVLLDNPKRRKLAHFQLNVNLASDVAYVCRFVSAVCVVEKRERKPSLCVSQQDISVAVINVLWESAHQHTQSRCFRGSRKKTTSLFLIMFGKTAVVLVLSD